ncbi:MAG: monovalent cation/H+ antiporter complex subunit F [Acidimicrobiales bacterium]
MAALDVMLVALMAAIAADAGFRQDATNLALILVVAIVGFTATVAASRFIEHESFGPQPNGERP